jgi:hypothetical protein
MAILQGQNRGAIFPYISAHDAEWWLAATQSAWYQMTDYGASAVASRIAASMLGGQTIEFWAKKRAYLKQR